MDDLPERFRALIENSTDGIALLSRDGTVLYHSPALGRILGYVLEERVGFKTFDLVHPEDREHATNLFLQLLEKPGETVRGEFRCRHKDGTWLWVEAIGTNLLAEPAVQAIVANYRDITERKRAEEALRESEGRFRNLVELSPDMIVVHSAGEILFINPAGARFLGAADPRPLIGKPMSDLIHPDFRQTLAATLEPIYLEKKQRYQIETRFVRLDGQAVDIEVSSVPIIFEGKDARQVIARDVSERKRAQQRLVYQSQLLANVHDAIIATDEHFTLTEWNRAAEQMYGWTAQEAIDRKVHDVIPTEFTDAQRAEALRILSETGRYRVEVIQYRRDGNPINVEGTTMTLRDAKGQIGGYVSVNRDITERKRAEEERARLYEQVRASREQLQILSRQMIEAQELERRRIARELHDEIGQVLTAVRTNLQAIQLSPDSSTLAPRLGESIGIVERALRQVRDLSLDLRPSLLDDFGLVPALEWYVDRQAERAGFKAEFVAEPPELRLSSVLETACFRVAQAALTNVARHAQAKHVRVELRRTETELHLTIRDDGIGFEVDAALERAAHGTSLGLLGMRERAHLAGGQIEIESASRRGTEIRARFPLSPSADDWIERRSIQRET